MGVVEGFKVYNMAYHRNGICGMGFYAVSFSYVEDGITRYAIGTVDGADVDHFHDNTPHDPATRILMMGPTGVDIDETMRGDHFHEVLCDYIWEDVNKRYKDRVEEAQERIRAMRKKKG